MKVQVAAQCALLPLPAAFRSVVQPALAGTDFPYIFGVWGQSLPTNPDDSGLQANIVAVPDAECIRLRNVFVPHYPDSSFRSSKESNGTTYPSLTWTHGSQTLTYVANRPGVGHVWSYTTTDGGTYWLYYDLFEPYSGRIAVAEVSASTPSTNVVRYAHASGAWQGFQWYYRLIASPSSAASIQFLVALGSSSPYRWVRVSSRIGLEPEIAVTTASLSDVTNHLAGTGTLRWDVLQRVQVPARAWEHIAADDRYSAIAPANLHQVQFEVLSQRLFVNWEGVQKPLVIPLDGEDVISIALIAYSNFTDVVWHGAPTKYVTSGVWESADHALGFLPQTLPSLFVHDAGSPAGTSVTTELVDPTTARYRLQLNGSTSEGTVNGVAYCAKTPIVRAVSYRYASMESGYAAPPQFLMPEAITIQHVFDYNTLTIQSNARLVFPNMDGEWATFNSETGQWGINIHLETNWHGNWRQFAGIAHRAGEITGESGVSKFIMHCVDRSVQLQNPRWNLPWMDGWNIYYAMAFLAQLGGVSLQDMAFAPFVPPDPYSDWGDPERPGAWFLPVGHAGTPLTRFSGQELWSIMVKLAYAIGYMLFFDANGVLQFRKFRIPVGVRRTFYESDMTGPDGCWNLSVYRSMEDVRNAVTVVGVDAFGPLWNPIVSHRQDDWSIHYPFAYNFVGWEQPLVWADSLFASPQFASDAADALIAFLRHPSEVVTFTTWLQPDLYPLDVIAIQAPRFGTMWKRYLVVGVQHRVHDVSLGESIITARYIPE
ncbi:MAG: hypothetical protein KatS3mg023_3901 [Armatimonadota bacterium]|nr:MAG: hypothetical protein KatS3mg023_3901 [Armatimonadota bacterium]